MIALEPATPSGAMVACTPVLPPTNVTWLALWSRYTSTVPPDAPAPAWLTVCDTDDSAMAALRALPVFALTEYATVPGPLPLAPEVIVNHEAVLAAFQEQPVGALTVKLPVPPGAATFELGGLIWYEQAVPVPLSYAPMSMAPTTGLGVAEVAGTCSGGTAIGGHCGLGNALTFGVEGAEGLPMSMSGLVELRR